MIYASLLALAMVRVPLAQRVQLPRLPQEAVAQGTAVRRLEGFLSDADIEAIHEAAAVVRSEAGDREVSATYERQMREGGRTVWLNHRLGELLPGLRARMFDAAAEADRELWGGVLEGREALSIRSVEYHTVLADSGIAMDAHADHGSLVTIDFMLSDPSEFEGGAFQTLEPDGSLLQHTFERGDALVFLSHKYHAVSALTSGRRNIMVCEIWEGVERRCPQRCDQPWMPCHCSYRPLQLLTRWGEGRRCERGLSEVDAMRERGIAAHRARELEARARREAEERSARSQSEEEGGAAERLDWRTPPPKYLRPGD